MVARTTLGNRLLALFFIVAGVNHFIAPAAYLAIMPPALPWPMQLIYLSGVAEILGGFGLLNARFRRLAAAGLIALLLAVLPANIYGALHGMRVHGHEIPAWLLWVRLPLQAVLIWWVYRTGWRRSERVSVDEK